MQPGPTKAANGSGQLSRTPTPTATSTRVTRSTAGNTGCAREEQYKHTEYKVVDASSGENFLRKNQLLAEGDAPQVDQLATTLCYISQMEKVPPLAREAIRAVSFLLRKTSSDNLANTLIEQLKVGLTTAVANNVIASISSHVATLHASNEALATNLSSLELTNDRITSLLDRTPTDTTAAEKITSAVAAVTTEVSNLAIKLDKIELVTTEAANTCSYSDAVRTNSPSNTQNASTPLSQTATAAIGRAAIRERQVLVDPQQGQSLYQPDQTTENIVQHLQNSLESTRNDDAPNLTIKAITRLRNGGVIMEFDSKAAANWVRLPDNKKLFLDKLGVPADIKDRSYTLMVPFLPIRVPVADQSWIREVELENKLEENTISSIRWIKKPSLRDPNQRVAHAIFTLTDPEAANRLIKDGLCVQKEKLHPKKERKEPLRCVRCQGWGHLARECKAPHDICAKCAHIHRTDECDAHKDDKFCYNCDSSDHSSNAPTCPTYLNKRAELDAKLPENSMPYFPTNESWTHVMLPPQPRPPPPPPKQTRKGFGPTSQDSRAAYRQTTLDGFTPANTQRRGRRAPFEATQTAHPAHSGPRN